MTIPAPCFRNRAHLIEFTLEHKREARMLAAIAALIGVATLAAITGLMYLADRIAANRRLAERNGLFI